MRRFDFKSIFLGNAFFHVGLILLFACGGVVAILFGKGGSDFLSPLFEDYFLLVFYDGKLFSQFLSRAVNNLALCVIFSAPFLFKWLLVLPIVAVVYRGYVFGVVMLNVVGIFGISGALVCIFLLIPMQFALQFVLNGLTIKSFCINGCNGKEYFVNLAIYYLLSLAVAMFEVVIIIVFIRPLSFII